MTQTKTKTSDYSSDDSPENRMKQSAKSMIMETREQQIKLNKSDLKTSPLVNASNIIVNNTSSNTVTTTLLTKTRRDARGGSVATSTPIATGYLQDSFAAQFAGSDRSGSSEAQRLKERTQNALNAERELNANRSKSKSLSGWLSSSYTDRSSSLNSGEHLAYWEYKKSGEYWKYVNNITILIVITFLLFVFVEILLRQITPIQNCRRIVAFWRQA